MTNLAKSTKTLFRKLYKGNAFTQSEISAMLWKVNHPREDAPAYNSYWHGGLEENVVVVQVLVLTNVEAAAIAEAEGFADVESVLIIERNRDRVDDHFVSGPQLDRETLRGFQAFQERVGIVGIFGGGFFTG